jgi:hypothetical protein
MKALKTTIKPKYRLINFRCTPEQEVILKKNAQKYAQGNISKWVRYIVCHGVPSKNDMAEVCAK